MTDVLDDAGIENSAREARWLVEAADGDPPKAEELALRRAGGEPLQYITGIAGFRRLELAVGPGVLVPRPETEVVAGLAMALAPPDAVVVDVGTGSGAIALALADERPDLRVLATESSARALTWARRNVESTRLAVELFQCDLFEGLPPELRGQIDVVVSNPPYVGLSERGSLPADVVDHEPAEALFAGEYGLDVIVRLIDVAPEWLRRGTGRLVIEIAPGQAGAVRALLARRGFDSVTISEDLAGRPRVAEGRLR